MRPNPVKEALKAGQPAVGTWLSLGSITWLSLGSITAARFLARTGFNWLTVDIEHSLCDWETAAHIFASVADAGCVALARVPAYVAAAKNSTDRDLKSWLADMAALARWADADNAEHAPFVTAFQAARANALAAAAVAWSHGLALDAVVAGLESVTRVPGRLEAVNEGQDFEVRIDQARQAD